MNVLTLGIGALAGGVISMLLAPLIATKWEQAEAAKFAEEIDDWKDFE